LFEFELLRGVFHFAFEFGEQSHLAAFEDADEAIDVFAVFLFTDTEVARGGALLDAGEEARAEPAPTFVPFFDVEAAGAELEDALEDLDCAAEGAGVGERAEEADAFVARGAGDFDEGEIVAGGDLQVGKGFVVFELFVVFGLDVFDQPGFHEEGINFAVAEDEVGVGNFVDPISGAIFGLGGFEEVAAGPAAKGFGLADVNHAAGGVFHQVDAGGAGEFAHLGGGLAEGGFECAGGVGGDGVEGGVEFGFVDGEFFGL
jgi:hypothetical protein